MTDIKIERRGDYDASNGFDGLIFRSNGVRLALFALEPAERIGVAVDGAAGEVTCYHEEPQALIDFFRNGGTAARSADEALMRDAVEALETCVWIGGEQLFNRPRVADAKSALRARLEGTTS